MSQRRTTSKNLRRAGDVCAWAALGEVAGNLVGLLVSDSVILDTQLGHLFGMLVPAVQQLGVFSRFSTKRGRLLRDCLRDADLLFIRDQITKKEHKELRSRCLKKWK